MMLYDTQTDPSPAILAENRRILQVRVPELTGLDRSAGHVAFCIGHCAVFHDRACASPVRRCVDNRAQSLLGLLTERCCRG